MPQTYSPFRYPGGKTQLYYFIEKLLDLNKTTGQYIEPFAGGAGLPIKLLLQNKVKKVWINDYDKAIYSVWHAILNTPIELIDRIQSVPFDYYKGHIINADYSISYWRTQKQIYLQNKNHQNSIDLAFATLFLNRTNISGIINGGPLGGFDQKNKTQIYARFNKETLINKIHLINKKREQIRLTRKDVFDMIPLLRDSVNPASSFIFFDPPYFEQGKNLYYSSFDEDGHQKLASTIMSLSNYKWITTYDKAPQITDFFSDNKQKFQYDIRYSANNKKRGHAPELMFASPSLKIESYDSVHLFKI